MNGRRKATDVPSSASTAHRRGPNLNLTDQSASGLAPVILQCWTLPEAPRVIRPHFCIRFDRLSTSPCFMARRRPSQAGNHAPKPQTPIWNRKTMDNRSSASSFGRPLAPLSNLAPDDTAREARSWACRGLEVRTDLDLLDKGYVLGTHIRIGTTWKWECHQPVRLLPSINPCPRTSDVRKKPGAFCGPEKVTARHIVDGPPKKLSREASSPSSPSYRNGGIYPAPDTLLFSTSYGAATTTTIIRTTTNTIPSIVTTFVLQRLPHHPLAANAVSDAAISIQHALSVDNTRARVGALAVTDG
ncbi:hypothetical protein CPLU01_05262 [Colletotrichum plurivorum]|uniref:Uncharacterized protein n=1 Tax=Colletotrichum plurivorum TaxID=2175906 RepID=A0A8H6KM12_9PEZI|nr:hypothetical protein CPLU01_05262 [Colletotrichum plurivorum]